MADLIDRQAAIDEAYAVIVDDAVYDVVQVETLEGLPSVEAEPVRHGHWYHGEAYPHHLYCSVCYRTALPNDEYVERWGLHMNYCPNCGARMDGKQDG